MLKKYRILSVILMTFLLFSLHGFATDTTSTIHYYNPPPGGDTNGLKGEYYENINFSDLRLTRVDPVVSFDWGEGQPDKTISQDTFSIRWTGYVVARYTETYTFHVISDDGVRLWIDDQLIINEWKDLAATEYRGNVALRAGEYHRIKLEYYDNTRHASVKLLWSSSRQEKEIIPATCLYANLNPTQTIQSEPVDLSAYFNEDAFSYDSRRSDGDYDGDGYTYSADLVNSKPVYEGVSYALGSMQNGVKNSVYCNEQTIQLPGKSYSSIRLAGSATNGDRTGVIRVNYSDGTYQNFSITMKDWCTAYTNGQKTIQAMNHRHYYDYDNHKDEDSIIANYIFAFYLNTFKERKVTGITLPRDMDMHVLAVSAVLADQAIPTPTPTPTPTPVPGQGTGLLGEYYDNMNFTDRKFNRTDSTVNFDWSLGSPDSRISSDTFSIRWTGKVEPLYSQVYTFYVKSDDGARLWVNGQQLINQWCDQSATEYSGSIYLEAGKKYDIQLEYYDNQAYASVKMMWSSQSQGKEIIPKNRLYSQAVHEPEPQGKGLKGEYYDNKNFRNLKLTRVDPTILFGWGTNSPHKTIGDDTFSIRWTGKILPKYSEKYIFHTISDDGVKLWVNGQLIIDSWKDANILETSNSIKLEAGVKYDIKLEYYEHKGNASMVLMWSSKSQTKEVVPTGRLFTE